MKWIRKIFRKRFFNKKPSIIKDFLKNPDNYNISIKSGIWMSTGGSPTPTEQIRITIERKMV